jgi:hypothetical protein
VNVVKSLARAATRTSRPVLNLRLGTPTDKTGGPSAVEVLAIAMDESGAKGTGNTREVQEVSAEVRIVATPDIEPDYSGNYLGMALLDL